MLRSAHTRSKNERMEDRDASHEGPGARDGSQGESETHADVRVQRGKEKDDSDALRSGIVDVAFANATQSRVEGGGALENLDLVRREGVEDEEGRGEAYELVEVVDDNDNGGLLRHLPNSPANARDGVPDAKQVTEMGNRAIPRELRSCSRGRPQWFDETLDDDEDDSDFDPRKDLAKAARGLNENAHVKVTGKELKLLQLDDCDEYEVVEVLDEKEESQAPERFASSTAEMQEGDKSTHHGVKKRRRVEHGKKSTGDAAFLIWSEDNFDDEEDDIDFDPRTDLEKAMKDLDENANFTVDEEELRLLLADTGADSNQALFETHPVSALVQQAHATPSVSVTPSQEVQTFPARARRGRPKRSGMHAPVLSQPVLLRPKAPAFPKADEAHSNSAPIVPAVTEMTPAGIFTGIQVRQLCEQMNLHVQLLVQNVLLSFQKGPTWAPEAGSRSSLLLQDLLEKRRVMNEYFHHFGTLGGRFVVDPPLPSPGRVLDSTLTHAPSFFNIDVLDRVGLVLTACTAGACVPGHWADQTLQMVMQGLLRPDYVPLGIDGVLRTVDASRMALNDVPSRYSG
ncbi:hypothetical protein FVE85_1026 [Porphyridium purpureum]|uniref:EF-hand domain-containing protein n=1 Tax=Porphyridium purpureum TaxID=35688 RepID=A0A5J4Z3S1_PORPP|nr:hypothetical protein FVE85_1026 [Porphyridium purpureum]|eukprot:POR2490..scf208_2